MSRRAGVGSPLSRTTRAACRDDVFGPFVTECPGIYDFTLPFENIILEALPSLVVLLLGIRRIHRLRKQRAIVTGNKLMAAKLVLCSSSPSLQILG